jgi:hypothetical protein
MTNQFLIARYISDLERREPRNIGIIAWVNGSIASRFLDVADVDFVEDAENYARWIDYWKELCSKDRIQVFNEPAATIKTPRFLKALQKTQKGNFVLDDGGEFATEIGHAEIEKAVDFIFSRVVFSRPATESAREPSLGDRCMEVFKRAGVVDRDDFKRRFPVTLDFNGVKMDIHFDFGIGIGQPKALWNKVNLDKEESVMVAAGKCDTAVSRNLCRKDQCFSLFDSTTENESQSAIVGTLAMFSEPLDIADPATPKKIRKSAA